MPGHKRALGGVAAAVSESPPAQRTRGAEQRAPFVTFNNVIDKASNIDVVQKTELKSQLVAKNLSDNFLPHMTKSQLMKRLNVSSDVAMCIRDRIVSFQREGRIAKKVPIPTSDDYDAVVAAVRDAGSAFGSRQKAIDDHCRSTGVMCHSGTVTKKMTANVDRRPRGKLSQASIDTISNLMYVATCDTTCKTLDTLKRFARACALLEQFYGSQEEYLNRMRQPEDLTEQPRVRHINLGLAQLAKDVIRALPAELAAVAYCNFTKTGYQTAESFKDASRALLVALHLQESPQLLLTWNTPMRDIPPLRRRYMFKVDGSRTHCLNDHQFLIEITSRNLVLFPYTPNATAFVQELDQLCLLIFKRIGRMIVKLELSAMSDKPDFRNRFVSLVWAQDVAHCYKLDLYAQESQENFAVSDEHHPSGHTGLSTYEISPDVCDIMKKISDRVHLAWGPVRLATMLGHAMGAALLNPTVLAASFDAVLEERVFRRPLVVRELNFAQHRATLIQHKTDALSALAATMSGNLVAPQAAPAGHLPALMREVSIPDEKWDMFCEHILHSSENHQEFRKACAIYGTFSQMYDESRKSADKIAAFQSMFTRAGNVADHAAAAEAESADAQARVVEAFGAWMEARADSLNTIVAKVCDSRTVLFANYVALLTAGLAAIPADNAAPRVIASFIPQLNRITKAGDKVSQELQLSSVAIQNLQQKVQTQKVSKFPHASFPAPLDATRVFDENSQQLLQDVAALQIELQQEIAREAGFAAVRQRAAAPSAPARGANRGRGRGVVAGRGRGGRGGARQVAVDVVEAAEQVAAAAPAAASSSEDEDVVLFHAQRLRERAEKEAAERDALQRSYAAVQDELDA